MEIYEAEDIFEHIKEAKDYIANIDKDFFIQFAELMFQELKTKEYEEENLYRSIQDVEGEKEALERRIKKQQNELDKKDKVIEELEKELEHYKNIIAGKTIQKMGLSDLYKED